MTNTLDHPRIDNGTFTFKSQGSPEVLLLSEPTEHTIALNDAQDQTLAEMERYYAFNSSPYLRHSSGGRVVGLYVDAHGDGTVYEVTLDEDGEPIDLYILDWREDGWRREIFDRDELPPVGRLEPGNRNATPNAAQSAALGMLVVSAGTEMSAASAPQGELSVLLVTGDAKRTVRATVSVGGKLREAEEWKPNRDHDYEWQPLKPGQVKTLAAEGI